jgi:beta-glucosidase-like glycosyl hydrolase
MRQVELPPFFRVTNLVPDNAEGVTDGLMTVHARYQGLQGNVPISLDARNLPALLALKEIDPWRKSGGLVFSAPLGAPAALEGISASRDVFPARRLAQDALLAGNDIMFVVDFAFPGQDSAARLANVKDAIGFFQEKYATDINFQAAVDQRVKRILKAKVKVFGPDLFNAPVLKKADNLLNLKTTPVDFNQIAQAGVSLIAPQIQRRGDGAAQSAGKRR